MIKIAILGVIAVLLALQFNDKKEYAMYISIVCMVVIALFVLDKVKIVADVIEQFNKYTNIDTVYIKMLLKMIGQSMKPPVHFFPFHFPFWTNC